MPFPLSVQSQLSLGGKQFGINTSLTEPKLLMIEETIAVAWDATLTTRTSATAGVLTMTLSTFSAAAAPIVVGTTNCDLYWIDVNGVQQYAPGVTISAISGSLVTFTIPGTGIVAPTAVLPPLGSDMQIALIQNFAFAAIGNNVAAILATADFAASIVVADSSVPAAELAMESFSGGSYSWITGVNGLQTANPLAGLTVATVNMSHNNITAPTNVRLGVLLVS